MPHFPKPPEGSWTGHYPELGTGPVSYEDSISPEIHELEKEAIFRRTWLQVGRADQLPRVGSYFTKEIEVLGTSIVVVRSSPDQIRAFHNVCRHRGNKLVWNDYPWEETRGTCRQFTCKYHGWRYDLQGACTFVQQESEFFDLDKSDYGLAPVECEVWEGFIFVNFDRGNQTSLRDYLGRLAHELEGYPFDTFTQIYKYRSLVKSNWKLYIDAFAEFYHAPVLHAKQAVADESVKLQRFGFEALSYVLDGLHGMQSSWGGMRNPKDPSMVKPIEQKLHSGLFGPWDDYQEWEPPPAVNPTRSKVWGMDSFLFFPNFMILPYGANWYIQYNYWPVSYNSHIFEGTLYFLPPRNAYERLQQELTAVTFKEYALQDSNTLEATQKMLESRAVTEFPLNDQEVMLRQLHHNAAKMVEAYKQGRQGTSVPIPAVS